MRKRCSIQQREKRKKGKKSLKNRLFRFLGATRYNKNGHNSTIADETNTINYSIKYHQSMFAL